MACFDRRVGSRDIILHPQLPIGIIWFHPFSRSSQFLLFVPSLFLPVALVPGRNSSYWGLDLWDSGMLADWEHWWWHVSLPIWIMHQWAFLSRSLSLVLLVPLHGFLGLEVGLSDGQETILFYNVSWNHTPAVRASILLNDQQAPYLSIRILKPCGRSEF